MFGEGLGLGKGWKQWLVLVLGRGGCLGKGLEGWGQVRDGSSGWYLC